MKYLLVVIACLACTSALVTYRQLEKGKNGCKWKDAEIPVADTYPITEVCGVMHCQNTEGDALILYCQIPPFYIFCDQDGIDTTIPFPECCWRCTRYVECGNDGKALDA